MPAQQLEAIALPKIAIMRLFDALQLARDAQRTAWDFALEIESLKQAGVHTGELRWLVCKEYVEHANETTRVEAHERTFEHPGRLSFTASSCFVLTSRGEELARILRTGVVQVEPYEAAETQQGTEPVWDRDRAELRYMSRLVKRYKVPSPNQWRILTAFQEERWPCRVDDPLPPADEVDPKRRLHDTIKSLNRHQLVPLLRFFGDGTGEGVRWGVASQ